MTKRALQIFSIIMIGIGATAFGQGPDTSHSQEQLMLSYPLIETLD